MGRVYTPDMVAEGRIPQPGAHQMAGQYLLNALIPVHERGIEDPELLQRRIIESAMIYGSTVAGTSDARSDLDVLANYNPVYAEDVVRSFFETVTGNVQERFHVVIEPQLHARGELPARIGDALDTLFAEHLIEVDQTQARRWSVNNPVQGLSDNLLPADDMDGLRICAFRYLDSKAMRFADALHDYAGFANLEHLQRAFELPSATGRKVLPVTREDNEQLPHISEKAAMRQLITYKIGQHFVAGVNRACMLEDQARLTELDQQYSQILASTVTRATSVRGYQDWIEDVYVEACTRAERSARGWADLIGTQIYQTMGERTPDLYAVRRTAYEDKIETDY